MAFDFPASPTVGQTYAPAAGILYTWNGYAWAAQMSSAFGVPLTPQGRLALQTLTPVMTTTQSAKTTIFYTPYVGNQIPIYNGTSMVPTTFSELTVATTDTANSPAAIGAGKVNDWFVWDSGGGVLRLVHGPDWTSDTTRSAGTALVMVQGIWVNNATIGNGTTTGPGAQRGTYVGTTRSNASSQLDWIIGGAASGGVAGFLGLWNCYNRVSTLVSVIDNGAAYTYSSATVRQARASANMQFSFIAGLAEDAVSASYACQMSSAAVAGAGGAIGIGYDSTTAFGGVRVWFGNSGSGAGLYGPCSLLQIPNPLGFHAVTALEASNGSNSITISGSAAGTESYLYGTLRM